MTDREMLELAAKVAGKKILFDSFGICRDVTGMQPVSNFLVAPAWSPLADDGDALRLTVKLGLAVSIECQVYSTAVLWGPPIGTVREPHNADPVAATRRAITRAAAEIGKGL